MHEKEKKLTRNKKIFNSNWYKFQGSVGLKSRQDNCIITRSNIKFNVNRCLDCIGIRREIPIKKTKGQIIS